MNTILILYPREFNCLSKLSRKLKNVTLNMSDYQLVCSKDYNGLIQQFSETNDVQILQHSHGCIDSINFTHAIVFDDGEEFKDEIAKIKVQGLPLRIIKIAITRVINIKNHPELAAEDSNEKYTYIGRGSYWGNPHSMFESMEDSSEDPRDEVIRMYKYDFDYDKFLNIDKTKVYELAGKRLGCFCKPFSCHGDVLADFLNQWDDGK